MDTTQGKNTGYVFVAATTLKRKYFTRTIIFYFI